MSEPVIRVRGLVTQFGDVKVHDGLDLDVERGEVLAVIGPSGSGKSVLLREIIGLETPTAGEIRVLGEPVRAAGAHPREYGVMFQDGALFSSLTLLENVEAPFKEHTHLPPDLRRDLAGLKLVMAGLSPDTHQRKPSEISGGMRKRAALARALALDPDLLFLDEPTAGLDPVTAGRFDALILDLAEALDLTVFLVTHDLDTLHAVADRIAVIHDGRIVEAGRLSEVMRSKNAWVQHYFSGPRGRATQKAHSEASP